jgi:hypothetical protein
MEDLTGAAISNPIQSGGVLGDILEFPPMITWLVRKSLE